MKLFCTPLVAAGMSLVYAQQPTSPFVHSDPKAAAIAAAWEKLETPDAMIRVPIPALTIALTNLQHNTVAVGVDVRIERDAATVRKRIAFQPLLGYARGEMRLVLTTADVPASLQFSGAIYAALAVNDNAGRPLTSVPLPPVYYHPDSGAFVFYRKQVLTNRFGSGDFRGATNTTAMLNTARVALLAAGRSGVDVALRRVSRASSTAGTSITTAAPGTKRFCLMISSDTFNDSSGRVWVSPQGNESSINYGEDYGRDGAPLPMARAYAILSQNGGQIWAGQLDQWGCTPYIPALSNSNVSVYYLPWYNKSATNITALMTDMNAGPAGSASVPAFNLVIPATASPFVILWMDPDEYAHSIFAAAAAAAERYPGGLTNAMYEFRLGLEGNNSGTATSYSPLGHPLIHIKYSTAAKSKFTLVHEYGHALVMAKLNPALTPAGVDYSVAAGEANQHTWTSKEWQLTAALEGFAHFVSGAVWNDVGPDADCKVVVGSDINPAAQSTKNLNTFNRYFETNYNEASYPDQGIEQDWAQFFWNYRTDTAPNGIGTPTDAQLVRLFVLTYPWPVHNGFFTAMTTAVNVAIPLPFPNQQQPLQRFLTFAGMAGIVH